MSPFWDWSDTLQKPSKSTSSQTLGVQCLTYRQRCLGSCSASGELDKTGDQLTDDLNWKRFLYSSCKSLLIEGWTNFTFLLSIPKTSTKEWPYINMRWWGFQNGEWLFSWDIITTVKYKIPQKKKKKKRLSSTSIIQWIPSEITSACVDGSHSCIGSSKRIMNARVAARLVTSHLWLFFNSYN